MLGDTTKGVHSVSEDEALKQWPGQELRVTSGPQLCLLEYDLHLHPVFPVFLHNLLLNAPHLEVAPTRSRATIDRT